MSKKKAAARKPLVTVVDISEESLVCRDLRHPWNRVTDFVLVKTRGAPSIFTRHLKCPRCDTQRFDTYAVPSFELLKTKTVYPKDYQLHGLKERVRISEVRREMFERTKRA